MIHSEDCIEIRTQLFELLLSQTRVALRHQLSATSTDFLTERA